MTDHPAIAAVPIAGTPNRGLLQALLIGRCAYVFGDDEDPTAFDPTGTGAIVLVLGYQGKWFWYDEADSTTAHDGTVCIVTAGGERYKIFGLDLLVTSVISHTETTPPDPEDVDEEARPEYGDAYRVPAGATGDWSGHADEIAIWTTREEWEFIEPKPGWLVWTRGIAPSGYDVAYHYDSAQGAWTAGFGGQAHPDGTIPQSATINFGKFFIVENQTTNTPPGSPALADAYVIGPSPTGAWVGHSGKIALCQVAGAFTIITPAEGWRVYDKALNRDFQFTGSAWQSATGRFYTKFTAFTASGTFSKDARCIQVKVTVIGSGGSVTTDGGSASFGSHASANGGVRGGSTGAGGTATASGGLAFSGETGIAFGAAAVPGRGGKPGVTGLGTRGQGTDSNNIGSVNGAGGGGGAIKIIQAADLATNESVTIGTGGANNGYVLVEEYIEN
jgi:hypothetical protein